MVGGCTPSKQATFHTTIQATQHATIQTSSALGSVCSFPGTAGHVFMRNVPKHSGKQCGSQRWGQGSRPDTSTCSATQTTLRLLRLGFMACVVGCCPWLSAHSTTVTSGTQEYSRKVPGSVREGLAGALRGTRTGAQGWPGRVHRMQEGLLRAGLTWPGR
jgi:hypothetical protein